MRVWMEEIIFSFYGILHKIIFSLITLDIFSSDKIRSPDFWFSYKNVGSYVSQGFWIGPEMPSSSSFAISPIG